MDRNTHLLAPRTPAVFRDRRTWRDLLLLTVLALPALALARWGTRLTLPQGLTLTAIWLGVVAVVVGQGWLPLFGPLLRWELVRVARQRRYLLLRAGYAVTLLLLLAGLYVVWTWDFPRGQNPPASALTRFAETFFFTFMCAELVAVLILTPVYTAGAIAAEKECQTLDFLLAADLHGREIVLSKLAARLANLVLLILVGLPILSVTQFFGGIDPNLVLTGFAVIGLTLLSLASLSMLFSVHAARSRTAIILTYLAVAGYLGLGCLAAAFLPHAPEIASIGIDLEFRGVRLVLNVQSVTDALNAGNLIVALQMLVAARQQNAVLTDLVRPLLREYAVFHVLASLGCMFVAILRLRAAATPPVARQRATPTLERWWEWPRLDANPLLWKELVVEPGFRLSWPGKLVVLALAAASFFPAYVALHAYVVRELDVPNGLASIGQLSADIQYWLRTTGVLVACVTLLAVAVRAAGSITGERDRQTLDSLLTTPLNRDAILTGKWQAAFLSVRWTWLWLGAIWGVGVATGSLSLLALPLLVWAWSSYAMFAASLGLYWSTRCRSTRQSTIVTLLSLLGVAFGHWLVLGCFLPFFMYSSGRRDEFPEWIYWFQKYGLTPPLTLQSLSFQLSMLKETSTANVKGVGEGLAQLVAAVVGATCYALAASFLWRLALHRFRELGIAQPLHRGLFGGSDNPFLEQLEAVPLAQPVEMSATVPAAK
ncbi:MAG: ABC transporter permease subunit [Planctomycetia bacterium]|nr:ABC transporter permease subunit [Planctomycetia bacterium]